MSTTLIEKLGELVNHSDPQVSQLGKILTQAKDAVDAGKITREEFVDIMVDAETLRKIITISDDLILYAKIHSAIEGVIEVAKLAKLI